MSKISRKALECIVRPIPLHVGAHTPLTYAEDYANSKKHMPVVSLTAIKRRSSDVISAIESIKAQSAPIHSVNLYISSEPYLIDDGFSPSDKVITQLSDLDVNIYLTPNIGPYRKIYYSVFQLLQCGAPKDTPIITIDDDVIYPENTIARLMDAAEDTDGVVACRGRRMTVRDGKFSSYRNFTLPFAEPSMDNLPNGRNGILYRLEHFPLEADCYVGHLIAPTADDLWLKLLAISRCIPAKILDTTAMVDTNVDFQATSPSDKQSLFHKFNKKGTNDVALQKLEAYFSVLLNTNISQII